MVHYTVGIAGHIDHGKTTLTRALTGIETDRLKEEKEREISIETGYAHFLLPNGEAVGVVDVPGHERFIRQMIAGSAGIDIVLLVIAANEGVMPQTREHLDILELLGVKKGIIVISKTDMVEEEFLPLVIEEVRETVQNTFLAYAPIVSVSVKENLGLTDLIEEISHSLATVPGRQTEDLFRLPIDRAFTIKGSGTVVTGTVFEGQVTVGDSLRLLPQDLLVRVRGLQVHHQKAEAAYAGQRTAINITGIEHDQVKRGDVLLVPNFLEPSQRIDLELKLLPTLDTPLKHRSRASVYVGTAEIYGVVLLFDRTELLPGEITYAQVLLDEPVVVKRGDPILLRRPTPTLTLGGGRVITPYGQKYPFRLETAERLKRLHQANVEELVNLHLRQQEKRFLQLQNELTIPWGILEPTVNNLLQQGELQSLSHEGNRHLQQVVVHREYLQECKEKLVTCLEEYHHNNPMQKGMKRSECKEHFSDWSEELFSWVIQQLIEQKVIQVISERLVLTTFLPKLPPNLQQKADQLLRLLTQEGTDVSDWLTLAEKVGLNTKQAEEIRRFYIDQGELVKLNEKMVWPRRTWEDSIALLRKHSAAETISIADVKEVLGLSRKYIIPILEMMDQLGITKRVGEARVWKS